jgi:pseudouridine kinase
MAIFDSITVEQIEPAWPTLASARWVFIDCNMPGDIIAWLMERRGHAGFKLAIDAVSAIKVMRLEGDLRHVDLLFLNEGEASALLDVPAEHPPAAKIDLLRRRGVRAVVLTRGRLGLIASEEKETVAVPGLRAQVVDVTGAGDALVAGTLAGLIHGNLLADACKMGMLAASLTVEHEASVHPGLSRQLIEDNIHRIAHGSEASRKSS